MCAQQGHRTTFRRYVVPIREECVSEVQINGHICLSLQMFNKNDPKKWLYLLIIKNGLK